jgi:hypothetical protein
MVDSNIGYIADFIPEILVTSGGIALFVATAVVFAVGGWLLISRILHESKNNKTANDNNNEDREAKIIRLSVIAVQCVLIAIVAFVVGQILLTTQYNSVTVITAVSISFGLWIVILALLAKAFVSWMRATGGSRKKRNAVVFVLTLSMIAYVANGVTGLGTELVSWEEEQKPEVVTSQDVAVFVDFDPGTPGDQMNLAYTVASAAAYVLTWIGTVMLLRPYIGRKIGKIKFYAIMGFAMVYYLIGWPLFVLGYYTPTSEETEIGAMNNILIFGIATVLSGIIFGAAFLSIARTLQKGSALRRYMTLAACGFVLFYVAGSAAATQLAYPPFGLATVAFTGFSCYLIYVGLYSAAVTVSQDYQIRESIRKSLVGKESESGQFLESIGTAHMQQERQKAVIAIARKNAEVLAEETGVEPSLDEGDMKEYVDEVVKEMEAMRKKKEEHR